MSQSVSQFGRLHFCDTYCNNYPHRLFMSAKTIMCHATISSTLLFSRSFPLTPPHLTTRFKDTNKFFQQFAYARRTKHQSSQSPKVHGNRISPRVRRIGNNPRVPPPPHSSAGVVTCCRGADVTIVCWMSAAQLRRWTTATQLCSGLRGKVTGK